MKVATTFSGGFGSVEFALKYLAIPHEVVFACEWMKPQRESYLINHGQPTANFYEDICDLDGTKYHGGIDYFHESPPCQEYSMSGNRGGAATEKGQLMYEAIKKIDQVQPKMFSVENVKGLLSSNNGEDWKNILKDFYSLKGYTISWGVINAKEQGTPQNRERVFIVGFRGTGPQMSFPKRVVLDKVLRDVLEDDVDEKYFLKDKRLKNMSRGNSVFKERFKLKDLRSNLYANCIDTKHPNRQRTATFFKRNGKVSYPTPRETSRLQGDFKDMFNLKGFSDTKLYEFIGNAMDISTTQNLITRMIEHSKIVKFTEPLEPSFEQSSATEVVSLFDVVGAA